MYHETSCTTEYLEPEPGKFLADTQCEKLPIRLCGDQSCSMVPGPQECHNKTMASVMDQVTNNYICVTPHMVAASGALRPLPAEDLPAQDHAGAAAQA